MEESKQIALAFNRMNQIPTWEEWVIATFVLRIGAIWYFIHHDNASLA